MKLSDIMLPTIIALTVAWTMAAICQGAPVREEPDKVRIIYHVGDIVEHAYTNDAWHQQQSQTPPINRLQNPSSGGDQHEPPDSPTNSNQPPNTNSPTQHVPPHAQNPANTNPPFNNQSPIPQIPALPSRHLFPNQSPRVDLNSNNPHFSNDKTQEPHRQTSHNSSQSINIGQSFLQSTSSVETGFPQPPQIPTQFFTTTNNNNNNNINRNLNFNQQQSHREVTEATNLQPAPAAPPPTVQTLTSSTTSTTTPKPPLTTTASTTTTLATPSARSVPHQINQHAQHLEQHARHQQQLVQQQQKLMQQQEQHEKQEQERLNQEQERLKQQEQERLNQQQQLQHVPPSQPDSPHKSLETFLAMLEETKTPSGGGSGSSVPRGDDQRVSASVAMPTAAINGAASAQQIPVAEALVQSPGDAAAAAKDWTVYDEHNQAANQTAVLAEDHKYGYIVHGNNFKRFRVEEKTGNGVVHGLFGVHHNNGNFRGVQYSADSAEIHPKIIYDTLVKFLSL